jgi:hypothetical protein
MRADCVDIELIIQAIRSNQIRITDHADEEAHADDLTYEEIFYSVVRGSVIEDYPDDAPYPSCLIYGDTFKDSPLTPCGHTIVAISGRC